MVSLLVSEAEDAVPNAESAQRRFVIRFARVRSPVPVKRMNARSPARPGLGSNQAGTLTSSGWMRSMSISPRARVRSPPPPPST